MPIGSGKSSLCKYLRKLVEDVRSNSGLEDNQPSWFLDDQSFEKMGRKMLYVHLGMIVGWSEYLGNPKILRRWGEGELGPSWDDPEMVEVSQEVHVWLCKWSISHPKFIL